MWQVTVNIDPKLIGPGELSSIIDKAVRNYIMTNAMENQYKPFISVEYKDTDKKDEIKDKIRPDRCDFTDYNTGEICTLPSHSPSIPHRFLSV